MKASATVRFKPPSKRLLTALSEALTPETAGAGMARSKVALERDGDFLVLKVEARDTVALRAALNAYLRWVGSVLDAVAVVESL